MNAPRNVRTAIEDIWDAVKFGGEALGVLDDRVLSESNLKILADYIKKTASFGAVFRLIDDIPKRGRAYDWNVGSILQHLDSELTVSSLQHIGDIKALYNSVGLSWVLAEYHDPNPFILDYLRSVVHYAKNPEAWWRAAFSLELLGAEDAVNLLKRSIKSSGTNELSYYLDRLDDKRSLIGILVTSNIENIQNIIYPRVRDEFLHSDDRVTVINCCWLIGRLKLIDEDIQKKLISLMRHRNYELKYHTFFALQHNATERLRPVLEQAVDESDPLIRKLAVRGLASVGSGKSLGALEAALYAENDPAVISEITKAIYRLKNPRNRDQQLIESRSFRNENGMIADESDKWYRDPSVYAMFSEAEDPENICFDIVRKKIGNKRVMNPIDLATGTGRTLWQVLEKVDYSGVLYGVDSNIDMCAFIEKNLRRERKYTKFVEVAHSTIADFPTHSGGVKSNLIISSFGFPSCVFNERDRLAELKAVRDMLADDGEFFTIGWDETFNDTFSHLRFKHAPGAISKWDFNEWKKKQIENMGSVSSCGLTWFKKGIAVPLQFSSLKESAHVMGYLFGRDAAQEVVRGTMAEWTMSLGITRDTKKDLTRIINAYEKRD